MSPGGRPFLVRLAQAFAALLPILMWSVSVNAQTLDHLAGRYVVVGARAASDVPMTAARRQADESRTLTLIGTELRIGSGASWYRDRCDIKPGASEKPPAVVDRNLADLQITYGSNDSRLNQSFVIDCRGRAIDDIWHVLAVDRRVLVARSSPMATYLILEKPLAPGDVLVLKTKLDQAGFDVGPVSGDLDGKTRLAIAEYARKHGAPALYLPGIVTENLLASLMATAR